MIRAFLAAFAGPALLWPIARLGTAREPRAFMYHRFSAGAEDRRVSSDTWRKHILVAQEHCELVTFTELMRRCSVDNFAPKRPLVALTVDDGYRDFYRHAFPVLQELRAPATVFVTAGFVEQRLWLWPDAFEYVLFNAKSGHSTLTFEGQLLEIDLTSTSARRRTWDLCAMAVLYNTRQRAQLLSLLQHHLEIRLPEQTSPEYEAMTWEEIREISNGNVEIGGHSWSHAFLPDMTPTELQQELVHAKHKLEKEIGKPVTSFAYPNGQVLDAPEKLSAAVAEAGYEVATVATVPTGARTIDRFRVGRWTAGEDLTNLRNILSGASLFRSRLFRKG